MSQEQSAKDVVTERERLATVVAGGLRDTRKGS